MYSKIIQLEKNYQNLKHCTLEVNYPFDNDFDLKTKPALLIIPGGAYAFCSKREKDPISLAFMLRGYVCFSLTYSVIGDGSEPPLYPQPQLQAIAAIDYIKKNAKKYHVDSNRIFVIGFSAGGHLAGTLGYLYKDIDLLNIIGLIRTDLKPKGICLCYPVITLQKKTHEDSMKALTNGDSNLIYKLSIENGVTIDYPPTIIWTTKEDNCVPIENSFLMKECLDKHKVKNRLIMFEKGDHGLSLATKLVCDESYPEVALWVEKVDKFFKNLK